MIDTLRKPLVSVIVTTYNQEKFIRKAIDSNLAQETSFEYEIIIGEDFSTDGTRDICVDYSLKYPDIIRLLLHQKNVGMHQNAIQTLHLAKGKYIAFCEGDDFWTDPNKLQMQFALLENNSEYSGVHSKVEYVDEHNQVTGTSCLMPRETNVVDFNYVLQKNVICTCSFMFRRSVLDSAAYTLLEAAPVPDYTLFLATALKGNIYYLDKITAAYRRQHGVTANWIFAETKQKHLKIYSLFEKHYNLNKYRRAMFAAKQYHYYHSLPTVKRLERGCYLGCLLWYSILTSLLPPKIRVYHIRLIHVFKILIKGRPRFRNLYKYIYND